MMVLRDGGWLVPTFAQAREVKWSTSPVECPASPKSSTSAGSKLSTSLNQLVTASLIATFGNGWELDFE